MSIERRKYPRYNVSWQGRVLLPDKIIYPASITNISLGGIGIEFKWLEGIGTQLGVEFLAIAPGVSKDFGARVVVTFRSLLADCRGAQIGLSFIDMPSEELHDLCNVLQKLGDG